MPADEHNDPFATQIIDDEHYLLRTFTNSNVRVSILRGSDREELVHTDQSSEDARSDRIVDIMRSDEGDVTNLQLEILLTHAVGKCVIPDDIVGGGLSGDDARFIELVLASSRF